MLTDSTPSGYVNYLTSNFIGCWVIGVVFALKDYVHSDLFVGVSVGFCGSLTTFSSWQLGIVETLVGVPGAPTSPGGKTYVWFQDQTIGFAVAFVGLTFGKHVGEYLLEKIPIRHFEELQTGHDKEKSQRTQWRVSAFSVSSATCAWLGMILGACLVPGTNTFSLIFAPFGAWLRFLLSRYLNTLTIGFYWGTFVANVLGSVIEGILFGILITFSLDSLQCESIWAVKYGFCGGLTTISTFVNELHTLPEMISAYKHGISSVLVTQALLIVIVGSVVWTKQDPFGEPSLCFYSN